MAHEKILTIVEVAMDDEGAYTVLEGEAEPGICTTRLIWEYDGGLPADDVGTRYLVTWKRLEWEDA